MSLTKRSVAEFIGTFWLVFGGCGSAVLAAVFLSKDNSNINLGIGLVGVSLAFGLTVLSMAYTIGHISGCHLNPAVSIGLCVGGRFPAKELGSYIIAQVLGAIAASGFLYMLISIKADFNPGEFGKGAGAFAANGYGEHSPGGYPLFSAFLAEVVLTFFFLTIILGATDKRAPQGFAPLAIGLGLTLIHLIGIPITNLSVNPARSTGPAAILAAFEQGRWAIGELWLFWVAPILGAILAGALSHWISAPDTPHIPHPSHAKK